MLNISETNIDAADVALLPRSGSVLYTSQERESEVSNMNLQYLEQNYHNNFLVFDDYRIESNGIDNIKITKLEDDTKELSETGISLYDTYTMGYISASSIHPQLANVHLKNHALSGSNLREAYEMHIKTAVPTMRMLLLHPVNTALKLNFPEKNMKLGFMDVAFEDFNEKNSTTKKTDNDIQQKQ